MEEPLQHQATTQCIGLPPARARGHHPDGPKANHALTFNLDHSSGAAQARRSADQVTYDRTVEAILCDLCAVELGPDNDSIHLPLSNKVLRSKSRYKGIALGKTLPAILDVMSAPEMDFVVVEKGHSTFKIVDEELNVAFAGGQQTILKAGPKLLSRMERFGITRDDLGPATEEEVLILRAPKRHSNSIAKYQEYEDDEATLALRQQMTDINDWLDTADTTCSHP